MVEVERRCWSGLLKWLKMVSRSAVFIVCKSLETLGKIFSVALMQNHARDLGTSKFEHTHF
jgi:hypothetical protein